MAKDNEFLSKNKLIKVGNYIFTGKLLGKGNFARVEQASHSILDIKVALKIIDTGRVKDDYVIKNLKREAKIMSFLLHPCIATLFETFQFGKYYCLIMEEAQGGELCDYIKSRQFTKLDELEAKNFGFQILSAIHYLHSKYIVHRDLKMENIMLDKTKTHIKLVDFGLSNIWVPNSNLKTHCGSPEYAAPELFINGKFYGPEVDLWSFGVILYGMVKGHLPFLSPQSINITAQERRQHLLNQINRGLTIDHRRELASLSWDFQNLISKLLVPATIRINTTKALNHSLWLKVSNKKIHSFHYDSNVILKDMIIEKLATKLDKGSHEINLAIDQNKFGEIGGMYNIYMRENYENLSKSVINEDLQNKSDSPSRYLKKHLNTPPNSIVKIQKTNPKKIYSYSSYSGKSRLEKNYNFKTSKSDTIENITRITRPSYSSNLKKGWLRYCSACGDINKSPRIGENLASRKYISNVKTQETISSKQYENYLLNNMYPKKNSIKLDTLNNKKMFNENICKTSPIELNIIDNNKLSKNLCEKFKSNKQNLSNQKKSPLNSFDNSITNNNKIDLNSYDFLNSSKISKKSDQYYLSEINKMNEKITKTKNSSTPRTSQSDVLYSNSPIAKKISGYYLKNIKLKNDDCFQNKLIKLQKMFK